jgi:pSer/pThr/pTyr-binding forkhead associated (FHA) protein
LLLIIGGAAILLILILLVIGRSRRGPSSPTPVKPPAPSPTTPPATAEAWLEFTGADGKAITFNLDKPVMLLGRDSQCDVALPASLANIDSVSRQHARFQRDQDGIIVHDLNSKNGLVVNGRHTNHNLLENGDRLAFGSVEATFHNQR